ncbi:hypothetical protein [Blastococcus xanthinilyticus]|uniref:Uncharacterized protein n=1 Tax=Blastococcus xanthinilyticus TaxID=1564164 RepID=A0A5S5CVY6_9ACTN|nr:hypothetical protein [Blastococcus xanthinilyticus]TYP87947.1 hypothetical protein BD833_105122 [Blastococcus xanthinilyticus]
MSESQPTGYRESPDTTGDGSTEERRDDDVALTTDEDAQREDSVARPGNESD